MRVRIQLTPPQGNTNRANINVYVRSFDVDDAGGVFDTGTGGDNQHSAARTTDNFPNEGRFDGSNTPSHTVTTTADGLATADFSVTMQPGDNFRIVAGLDQAVVSRLTVQRRGVRDGNRAVVESESVPAEGEQTVMSELLTIWRQLHVEVDSMPDPPDPAVAASDADPERNYIRGSVNRIDGNRLYVQFPPDVPLDDGSAHLGGQGVNRGNGRFERGSIEVGTGAGLARARNIDGNAANYVNTGGIDIPFRLADSAGGNVVQGNDIGRSDLANRSFTIGRGTGTTNYGGGTLTVAGEVFNVVSTRDREVTVDRDPLLPFLLRDDNLADAAPGAFLTLPAAGNEAQGNTPFVLMQDSLNRDRNVFAAAFVIPKYDLNSSAKTPGFNRNVEYVEGGSVGEVPAQNRAGRDNLSNQNYWTVYLQGAFQGPVVSDHDPASETTIAGGVTGFGSGSLIFAENLRETEISLSATGSPVAGQATEKASDRQDQAGRPRPERHGQCRKIRLQAGFRQRRHARRRRRPERNRPERRSGCRRRRGRRRHG